MRKYSSSKAILDKCYSDAAPSEKTVKRWHADFKRGRTDINDAELLAHPNSVVVPENTKKSTNLFEVPCDSREVKDSVFTNLH